MLYEKTRHPDQSLYLHPGTRGIGNPTILVPDFIERRYDNMEEARGRDGISNLRPVISDLRYKIYDSDLRSQLVGLNLTNHRHDVNSPSTSPFLPPILESDTVIKPQNKGIVLQQMLNNHEETFQFLVRFFCMHLFV